MPLQSRSPHAEGLEAYLEDLGAIPPLQPDELTLLSQKTTEGNAEARERIVLTHLELVVKIAYRYGGYGLPLADLISEGNLGLLRAAELYDSHYGVPFPTYAGVWIKQRMHRAITAQAHAVRIPVWRSQRLRKLDRIHADLHHELGRGATLNDLAERIGIPEEALEGITRERLVFTGIDHLELEGFHAATPGPAASMQSLEIEEEIAACLEGLNDTELEILSLRFGLLNEEPESYRSMAPQFGKSREWIRRTGEHALQKLKDALTAASDLPRDLIAKRQKKLEIRLNDFRKKRSINKNSTRESLSFSPLVLTEWVETFPIICLSL